MVARLPNFEGYRLAVGRVERLLNDVTQALDNAGIPYAVIGGNAVAVWVATVDDGATRSTKNVDLLVRRSDAAAIAAAVAPLNLYLDEAGSVPVLLDRDHPKPSQGVHLIYASERIRKTQDRCFPDVDESIRSERGFKVIGLRPLVVMKLEAFRRVDQLHIEDMLRSGLIDSAIVTGLPADLLNRLREIRDTMDWPSPPPMF